MECIKYCTLLMQPINLALEMGLVFLIFICNTRS